MIVLQSTVDYGKKDSNLLQYVARYSIVTSGSIVTMKPLNLQPILYHAQNAATLQLCRGRKHQSSYYCYYY